LSSAQKFSLLCSKLCSQNQDYARDLTVLLEYIREQVTALLEYLDPTFMKCEKSAKKH